MIASQAVFHHRRKVGFSGSFPHFKKHVDGTRFAEYSKKLSESFEVEGIVQNTAPGALKVVLLNSENCNDDVNT